MTDRAIAWSIRDTSPKPLDASADDWVEGGAGEAPPRFLDGPTIADVNSGFVRHSVFGVRRLYQPRNKHGLGAFQLDKAARDAYRRIGQKLRELLMAEFGLDQLFFTAPTFVARIQGSADWQPRDVHDEYWHPHVDKNNTGHYDYSALVYLADAGDDFQGGEFQFMDEAGNTTVLPARGRAVLFTSGTENLHRVVPVREGVRYAVSLWFTCDETRHMSQFLDGRMHGAFAGSSKRRQREIAARRRERLAKAANEEL